MRRLNYNPSLDGLRALAVLSVCAYHMSALSGGYLGVDLFLVLSGFLITALMLDEWAGTGTISISAFYVRRAYRLLPAFYTFVAVGAVLVVTLRGADRQREYWESSLAALFYYGNYRRILEPIGDSSWFGHVWSLSLEEQFYVLWPLGLVFICRRPGLRARLLAILLGAALAVMCWRFALIATGAGWMRLYFGLDTRADALLLGCALAAFRHDGLRWSASQRQPLAAAAEPGVPPKFARILVALGPIAFVLLALCMIFGPDLPRGINWFERSGFTLIAVLASCVVLSVDQVRSSLWSRLLASRPLAGLGRISYGFYLWHFPVTSVGLRLVGRIGLPASLAATIAVSIGLAAISFRWIEQPAQRRRPLWASGVATPKVHLPEPSAPEHRAGPSLVQQARP
jgi:peptidoglycan/LPS O-acetylase OafA/YrhL